MENVKDIYDVVIVGGGPAGLSAAIYMARAKYKTLVIEKEKFGGQITITNEIVNYPGVYNTSGKELTSNMQRQAQAFGAEFKLANVTDMELAQDIKIIKTTSGEIKTLAVILAVGANPRKIGFEGEQEFAGRGVAYCATCDGEFFTGKTVYVVGGGFAAVEEGIFLTKYASAVKMLVRKEEFACAKSVTDHLEHEPKISVRFNSEVVSVSGENSVSKIKIKNNKTGEITEEVSDDGFGVFVFAGYEPNTKWLNDAVATEKGYIITDQNQQTNIPGVYAAGDVCIKELRQVVTAVSDGAVAATSAEKYAASVHNKLNLQPFDMPENLSKPASEPSQKKSDIKAASDSFIDEDMKEQLLPIFGKFENVIQLHAVVDNSDLGNEMAGLMKEFNGLSENIHTSVSQATEESLVPFIEIKRDGAEEASIKFHAMPGGHEFNSFVLAMYNVAGPGKEVAPEIAEKISGISKKIDIQVLISLSCTMCPDVVVATQRIASLNPNVTARVIDISKFTEIKDKYNVMSVPCMVVNDDAVHFGKKDISQILELL